MRIHLGKGEGVKAVRTPRKIMSTGEPPQEDTELFKLFATKCVRIV